MKVDTVSTFGGDMIELATSSLNEIINVIMAAELMLGAISGKVIFLKIYPLLAPDIFPAWRILSPICIMADDTYWIVKGRYITEYTKTINPKVLYKGIIL